MPVDTAVTDRGPLSQRLTFRSARPNTQHSHSHRTLGMRQKWYIVIRYPLESQYLISSARLQIL